MESHLGSTKMTSVTLMYVLFFVLLLLSSKKCDLCSVLCEQTVQTMNNLMLIVWVPVMAYLYQLRYQNPKDLDKVTRLRCLGVKLGFRGRREMEGCGTSENLTGAHAEPRQEQ